MTLTRGHELHDRATRGLPLNDEERAELDAWYAKMDAEEAAALRSAGPPRDLRELEAGVADALTRLIATAERVRALEAANAALREEVRGLREELARRAVRSA